MALLLPPVICTDCWEAAERDLARMRWTCPGCLRELTDETIRGLAPSLGNPRQ